MKFAIDVASEPISGAAMAGRYTVTVYLETDPEDGSYVVPFELDLGVSGAAQPGPAYAEEPTDPDAASAEPSAEPEEDPSTAPSANGNDNDSAAADDGGSTLGLAIGGAGVLALLAAGFVTYRHVRQARPDSGTMTRCTGESSSSPGLRDPASPGSPDASACRC